MLINPYGEEWRLFRATSWSRSAGRYCLARRADRGLFYLFRGRILIDGGRSGKLVPRFSVNQRVVHWFAASQLVMLGVTGLVLLYGRYVLIPLLGPEGFSATAAACKEIHNLFGPIFPFAVIALIVLFGRGNWFKLARRQMVHEGRRSLRHIMSPIPATTTAARRPGSG